MRADLSRLPVRFEENRGQFAPSAKYVAATGGATLTLTDDGASLRLDAPDATLTLRIAGGRAVGPRATEPLVTRSHYFTGGAPSRWRTDVPNFARVTYPSVLDGIDLVYHGDAGPLEYDVVVSPGADPDAVALEVGGADSLALTGDGRLAVRTPHGTVEWPAPTIYQDDPHVDGRRQAVRGGYKLGGRTRVGFEVASYDRARPLVIDPAVAYSTYLGTYAYGDAIAVDAAGNTYVTGTTANALAGALGSFAPAGPSGGAFVAKLDAAGTSLVYVTYLGSGEGEGIAVDAAGDAYVTGVAQAGFATKNALHPDSVKSQNPDAADVDAFVAELAPSGGALVYSTFLGGIGSDVGHGIAVDASGDAFVTGETDSSDFPLGTPLFAYTGPYNGAVTNAFVVELAAGGSSLVYGTFLGGTFAPHNQLLSAEGSASSAGIALDGAGNAYVTGTAGPGFPLKNSLYPAPPDEGGLPYVTEIAAGGASLVYSTFLQGLWTKGIAVDASGDAYVTGTITSATDFATANAAQATYGGDSDAFVTKLAPSGTAIVYTTYLGGTDVDDGLAIAVDGAGNAFVTGTTSSADFPTRNAVQASISAPEDAFVTMIAPSGAALVYSTYLGGNGTETGNGIAVDDAGNAHVIGTTWSPDFPTRNALAGAGTDGGTEIGRTHV